MKLLKIISILLLPLFLFILGCNSTIYDIVEIEEPVTEPVSKTTDTNLITDNRNSEIKQDLKPESKLNETKFSDKQLVSKHYTIQIGAFLNESNAVKYLNDVKRDFSEEIYYKEFEGLYKVRIGNFKLKTEAMELIVKLQNYGFSDSFIVELKYYQEQDN
ncbi:MAG TPA: SPOR domain-containing protein [Ignavibacteria bacterium]|nr:SPOR domain-containing protein [Ignavibacteria bacterium]